jgi:hypothetical protein
VLAAWRSPAVVTRVWRAALWRGRQSKRARLVTGPLETGGAGRNRTDDLYNAIVDRRVGFASAPEKPPQNQRTTNATLYHVRPWTALPMWRRCGEWKKFRPTWSPYRVAVQRGWEEKRPPGFGNSRVSSCPLTSHPSQVSQLHGCRRTAHPSASVEGACG